MEPSRSYSGLVQEINAIISSLFEPALPPTITGRVEEMITHIYASTKDNRDKDKDVRELLGRLIERLRIRGYKSLVAKVEQVARPEFMMTEDIKYKLDRWMLEGSPDEDRTTARRKVIDFLDGYNQMNLYLLDLKLRTLPNIFNSSLFSERLSILNIDGNQLTTLPAEIGQLKVLKELEVREGKLSTLPKEISQLTALNLLNVKDNQLTEVSAEICKLTSLERLYLGGNRLTTLPAEIGQLTKLVILYVDRNQLTLFPAEIGRCQSLDLLKLNGTALRTLPDEIGRLSKLRELYLYDNPALAGIPLEMLNLPRRCVVDISRGTSFSQAVLDNLRRIVEAPGYTGPRFSYSMAHANPQATEERSVEELLTSLYKIVESPYEKLANIPGDDVSEPILKAWLSRLSYMSDYKASPEKRRWLAANILEHLKLADKDKKFRQLFNVIIDEAAETCGDRVVLSVVYLGIAHKLATIDLSNMKELAHFLIRGSFAMSLLEGIARDKIPSLPFFDEIEVYLGYPVMLKERLQLPIDIQEMLYFTCSALKQQDLDDAASFVLNKLADEASRLDFLIRNDKWQKALALKYPLEYVAIENERSQGTEADIQRQTKWNQSVIELSKQALKS